MMKRVMLFLACVLIFSVMTYAETVELTEDIPIKTSESGDFSVELITVDNKIPIGGTAVMQLKITNDVNRTMRYRLNFDNTGEWLYIRTDPTDHGLSGINIEKQSSVTTTINIKAREETGYGTLFLKTTVINEDTNENVVILLPVGIKTEEELAGMRVPDLRVSLDVPSVVDPRAENYIIVYLLNKNNRDITELTIELESNLLGKKEIKEPLAPNEEKEVKVKIELDPLTRPQDDTVKGKITAAGYTFTPTAKSFHVVEYNAQLKVDIKTEKGFLKTAKLITIENQGNDVISDTIKSEMGFVASMFTKTEPEARIVEIEGSKYYSWPVNAEPQVKSTIKVMTNYQPLFWFIVFVMAVLITRYIIKSKVRVIKKSTGTETSEGGLSNIKMMLIIKNDTGKQIKDIEIRDTVPHIATIKKDFPAGTLEPDKILVHKTKGTIVKWKIDELDIGEERIIKYEIKSKLSILGSFTLPKTKVLYRTITGKQRSVESNKLVVGEE
jgi:hypothetical protein